MRNHHNIEMGFLHSQLFVTPAYPHKTFEGQTVIVTGSNVGLGKEAARHIARAKAAKVILAVRNTKAGEEAREDILSSVYEGQPTIEVWSLDLSSFESVKAFGERASKLDRLDAVIENAGIATAKFELAEGYERTVTVNVIGTFLLALLLVPTLQKSAKQYNTQARLAIVSSEVHGWTKFPEWKESNVFDALNKKDNMKERYPTSKLLEVLVIRKIAPMLQGKGVTLNMLNPGLCHSELGREAGLFLTVLKFFLARTTEVGSRTLVASACAGPESHGKYMHDGKVNEGELSPFVTSAEGDKAADKVWNELKVILEKAQPGVTKVLS
jgi:NAD(P)-dependent dehydrogenase (short-subunit alcohol dehydrogenase family)